MPITIGSNIASLNAQRQLGRSSEALTSVFERLSSGQRINKASDDAAGLAIASSLNANARVYAQSVRNLNDAISASSIAQAATGELSNIIMRLQELAEQSANGTFTNKQRTSMNSEGQALRSEFNRIIETTSFNGVRLIDENAGNIRIQAGDTDNANILYLNSSNLGTSNKGTGTFTQTNIAVASGTLYATSSGDVTNDGILDLVTSGFTGVSQVYVGRGDGSFTAGVSIDQGSINQGVALGDVSGDGNVDIVMTDATSGISIYGGNGDGTFKARSGLSASTSSQSLQLEDLDNNGTLDMIFANTGQSTVEIIMSNGDGTFKARQSYTASNAYSVAVADFDGDGKKDLGILDVTGAIYTRKGMGDGTFQGTVTLSGTGSGGRSIGFGDINQDNRLDIISSNSTGGTLTVNLNQGNGTFSAGTSYTGSSNIGAISVFDYDGDSITDVIANDNTASQVRFFKGYGNGSLGTGTVLGSVTAPSLQFTSGDFDGDGSRDVAIGNSGAGVSVFNNNGTKTSRLGEIDLASRTGALAAIRYLNRSLTNLLQGVGKIGADESRFTTELNVMRTRRENYLAASSRVMDADVAFESSELTRYNILQQTGAAILAQANQQPSIALQLLGR